MFDCGIRCALEKTTRPFPQFKRFPVCLCRESVGGIIMEKMVIEALSDLGSILIVNCPKFDVG